MPPATAADEVARFLMRCIFTMFAEDVDLHRRARKAVDR
jgi:hypothetical protein